jgi:hypothetical protein
VVKIAFIRHCILCCVRVVEVRKDSVIKSIGAKITPDVRESLKCARTLQDVDDIVSVI